jgi:hypothetical protein
MSSTRISPAAVRRELTRLGFVVADSASRGGDTWWKPEDPDAPAVLVPREPDEGLAGYHETLSSAIERLSWITRESIAAVQQRLSGMGDRLELRILHALTARHTLRVLDAPRVVSGFVNLIKSGARTEFAGARVDHRGPGGDEYDTALSDIELLAPVAGSFRLIAVVATSPQLSIDSTPPPIGARNALASTLRSLEALSNEARPAEDLSEGDVERLVDSGVSLQLVNAVDQLAITETAGLQLEFSAGWDSTLGLVEAPSEPVVIGDAQISLVRGLKPRLKSYEPVDDYSLVGWVETAQADALHPEGHPTGSVVVRAQVGGRSRDIRVALDGNSFPKAKPGVSMLHAVGTLERVSGRWHLLDPHDIRVLQAQPPPE